MVNLKKHTFGFQIRELREYMLWLDEKIQRYEKQGRDPGRLIENKARAAKTIETLKQAVKQQYYTIATVEIGS